LPGDPEERRRQEALAATELQQPYGSSFSGATGRQPLVEHPSGEPIVERPERRMGMLVTHRGRMAGVVVLVVAQLVVTLVHVDWSALL
jgi:hypothetical protein